MATQTAFKCKCCQGTKAIILAASNASKIRSVSSENMEEEEEDIEEEEEPVIARSMPKRAARAAVKYVEKSGSGEEYSMGDDSDSESSDSSDEEDEEDAEEAKPVKKAAAKKPAAKKEAPKLAPIFTKKEAPKKKPVKMDEDDSEEDEEMGLFLMDRLKAKEEGAKTPAPARKAPDLHKYSRDSDEAEYEPSEASDSPDMSDDSDFIDFPVKKKKAAPKKKAEPVKEAAKKPAAKRALEKTAPDGKEN
jgi:hypothetical protein